MPDSNLSTSIAAVKTKITTDAPTATVDEILSLARAAKSVGLSEDAAVESAINSRVLTLSSGATTANMVKLSNAIKQMRDATAASSSSSVDLTAVSTNIIPDTDVTYDLGSSTHKFRDLYLDGSTLNLGNQTIKATATGIEVPELKIGTGTNTVQLTVASDGKLTTTETDSSGNTSSPAASGGGGSSVTVSDTAPTSPSAGDQWFDSSSLTMFVYYADGSSSQWVPATPAGQTGATGSAGAGGSSVTSYANLAAFPSSGNAAGDFGFATDTKAIYAWDGIEWDRIYTDTNAVLEWTTEPPATADLASDGTATTQTVAASDPEGFPIEYSYDTNPSNQAQATISNTGGAFTITPSTTEANAGDFILRYKASDGLHSSARSTTYSLGFSTAINISTAGSSPRMTINANSTTGALSITSISSSENIEVGYAPTAGLKLGKQYIELELDAIPSNSAYIFLGIGDLAMATAGTLGWNTGGQVGISAYIDNSRFFPHSGTDRSFGPLDDNVAHTIMFAYDTTAGRVWFGFDGTWDTSTNTGGAPGTGAGIDISGINFFESFI